MSSESGWKHIKKLGVAICHFKPSSEDGTYLPVCVGDSIHVVAETADWYAGVLKKDKSVRGIVPKSYIILRDSNIERIGQYETLTSRDPAVVKEITSVLREWGPYLQQLFANNKKDTYKEIYNLMLQLIKLRRDILSRKLTEDDFKKRKIEAANKIDSGNLKLELDLTLRDEDGGIIDPEEQNTIELYNNHKVTVERNVNKQVEAPEPVHTTQRHTLNLFVSICNVVCRVGDDADVLMSLYDSKQQTFFSENSVIKWSAKGLPKDIDNLNNFRVLFTDLGSKDLKANRESIFLVVQVIRCGDMFPPPENDTKPAKPTIASKNVMKRPFGVAALDVTAILNGNINPDDDRQHFVPIVPCNNRDFLETVIREAVTNKEITQNVHKGQGVWVNVKLLEGNKNEVQETYPHLFVGNTIIARKMGFPEVIMPDDVRNDFYVTLNHGTFENGRNIEIVMQVCTRDGKPLQVRQDLLPSRKSMIVSKALTTNVVSVGGGADLQSEYKSVVYRHQDSPRWFETFKIAVPIEEFYSCHLKFLFRHKSSNDNNRDFALSHVSFTRPDGTTLPDGVHDLVVYTYDSKKAPNEVLAYIGLPSVTSELDKDRKKKEKINSGPYQQSRSTFQISTLSCSTKLTHNPCLLGILNWKQQDLAPLHVHLKELLSVDGEEIVKFLQDIHDALFDILNNHPEEDQFDRPVYNALLYVIGLISDRKYQQFKQVLDGYIEVNFSATLAYLKLIAVLKSYLDNANNEKFSDVIYKSFKSINYLFKFIVRSRTLYATLNENRASVPYVMSVRQLLQSIVALMQYDTREMLKIQGQALKSMPTIIEDMVDHEVLERREFTQLLCDFIHNMPTERLTRQKLQCIKDIINSKLFEYAEPRSMLLKSFVDIIADQIALDTSIDLQICAEIVSDILNQMSNLVTNRGASNDMQLLFDGTDLLRVIIQTVIKMDRKNKLVKDYTALMIAMLRQMSEEHYRLYIHQIATRHEAAATDLADFLAEIIMVFTDLINGCVFPDDWNEMIMMQNKVFLKALRQFSHTIKERFTRPFNDQLWNNFFHCARSFLTQPALQIEKFSPAKRRKIIARYGDMRREMSNEVKSMWQNLGHNKIYFIPSLVGPFLDMTLIPDTELRRATIPLFYDMMQCEFHQSVEQDGEVRMNGTFQQFEDELITQLDAQVEGGAGDEEYIDLFFEIIHGNFSQHTKMKDQGLRFVDIIKKLLVRLLEYRTIIYDDNKENRMNCIVNLLNFYRDIGRQEMYIRYLNKLSDLHLECNNFTEAAHTLLLYSELLNWSDEMLDPLLRSDMFPSAQTHRELKDGLYHKIIEHFDQGKMWEKGIEYCKLLARQYESEIFDYDQLIVMLKKQADLYNKILGRGGEPRHTPSYYRVSYFGYGFPSFISNQTFIYRGKDYEQIADFKARIRELFPNAKELTSLNAPGPDIEESSNQYLQINVVNPIFEPQPKFIDKEVSEQILRYWRTNEVDQFSFSRPISKTQDVTKLWLERTDMKTQSPLPGILRWSPVDCSSVYKVSPLMSAIEALDTRNSEFKVLIEEHRVQSDLQVNTLNMKLQGVCDPAVNGGLANYKAFFDGGYFDNADETDEEKITLKENEKHENRVDDLREVIATQMTLVADGLRIFDMKCPDNLKELCDYLFKKFEEQIKLVADFGVDIHQSVLLMKKSKQPQPAGHHHAPHLQMRSHSFAIGTSSNEGSPMLNDSAHNRKTSHPEKVVRTSSTSLFINRNSFLRDKSPSRSTKSGARNSGRVASGYSTDSKDSGDSEKKSSDGQVIELTETLTPARPARPKPQTPKSQNRTSSGKKKKLEAQLSLPSNIGSNHTKLTSPSSHNAAAVLDPPIIGQRTSRSHSVKGTNDFQTAVLNSISERKVSYPNTSSVHIYAGHQGSLSHNDSFDASDAMTSSPSTARRPITDGSSPRPPIPEKRNTSHSEAPENNRVTLRSDSHKGKPPAALPQKKPKASNNGVLAPPIPEKRSSLGASKSSEGNT